MFADPTLLGVAGSVAEVERITMADRWRARHMKQHYGMREVVNPRFLFGANTIYRREVLEKVGPYPTRLRTNGEDLEICVRITKRSRAGLKYISTAVVSHLRRDTLSSLASTYWKYQTYLKWAFSQATAERRAETAPPDRARDLAEEPAGRPAKAFGRA